MGKSNASCIDRGLTAEHQDLLMDWSLLRPHARFMFLREELLYSSYIPVRAISSSAFVPQPTALRQFYYLAIVKGSLL